MDDSPLTSPNESAEKQIPSELAARLDRRRTEPVGIIDSRQPKHQISRTAGWIAQRFALLDRLNARYRPDNEIAAGEGRFVFAAAPGTQPGADEESMARLSRGMSHATEKRSTPSEAAPPDRLSSHSESFRVRRPGTAPNLKPNNAPQPPQLAGEFFKTDTEAGPNTTLRVDPITAKSPASSGEKNRLENSSHFFSPVTPVNGGRLKENLVKADSQSIATTLRDPHRSPPGTAVLFRKASSHRVEGAPQKPAASGDETGHLVQRKVFPSVTTEALPIRTTAAPPAERPAPSLPFAVASPVERKREENRFSTAVASGVPAEIPDDFVFHGRTEEGANQGPSPQGVAPPKEPIGTGKNAASPAAAEALRSFSSPIGSSSKSSGMIWRKTNPRPTDAGSAGSLPLSIGSTNGGGVSSVSPASIVQRTVSGATPTPAATEEETVRPETGRSEVDLEELTEAVTRAIKRRLAVERERLGVGRWR